MTLKAVRLMNFDPSRIPKIREVMRTPLLRVSDVRKLSDVEIGEPKQEGEDSEVYALEELTSEITFAPHPGWVGHIERTGNPAPATPMTSEEESA